MHEADGDRERLGRMLRGGALAVCLLALVAVVGPRLAFSGHEGAPAASVPSFTPGTTIVTAAAPSSTSAVSTTTSPTVTTSSAGVGVTADATTTTAATTTPSLAAGPDEGAVSLSVAGLHDGLYGPPRSGFFAGDVIGWHFRVGNTGGEYLWGVFVYLEGYGPVACEARRLEAGAATDCWAETIAAPDESAGEAWVTAWTSLRMVTDRLSHRVLLPAA
jgi:hypothetical protein